MSDSKITEQQSRQVAEAISTQAANIEEVLATQGMALVDQMAAQALAQAEASAAGRIALHAQQRLAEMAGAATQSLTSMVDMSPSEIEGLNVIEVQTVPLELPPATKALLPTSQRMLNSSVDRPSKSAKRRSRRSTASQEDQG